MSIYHQPRWESRVNELLTVVEVINDPDDASPRGQFEKVLDAFLTGKVQARHRDEIMNAKPWHDKEGDKVYFRSEDLFIYLEARRFRFHSQHQIWSWLRGRVLTDKNRIDDELRDCPWCGAFTQSEIINGEICCGACKRQIDKAQSTDK